MVRNYSEKTLAKNTLDTIYLGLARDKSFKGFSEGYRKFINKKIVQTKQDIRTYELLLKRSVILEKEWTKNKKKFIDKYASSELKQALEQYKRSKSSKS